jgi:glycosyltransferase involved in cell wall biosynthesis
MYLRNMEEPSSIGRPMITVVLPAYNAAPYVTEAVESILRQSFSNFELIAIDDGSTDQTADILIRLAPADKRIRVVRQRNAGVVSALNRGLVEAQAPYVAIMHADDVASVGRLQAQWDLLESHPEVGVVGGAVQLIDSHGNKLHRIVHPAGDKEAKRLLAHGPPFAHPAVMMRTALARKVGGYRRAFYCEDYDLWLRLAEITCFANLPEVVLNYRLHPAQASFRGAKQMIISACAARAAANVRGHGRRDPFDTVTEINRDILRALNVTDVEVQQCLRAELGWRISSLVAHGETQRANALADELLQEATTDQDRRLAQATIDWYWGRAVLKQGEWWEGTNRMLHGVFRNPRLMKALIEDVRRLLCRIRTN